MSVLIELDQVQKTFVVRTRAGRLRRARKLVRAVDDVSFSVAAGSMVGYIGPNGECRVLQPAPPRGHRPRGLTPPADARGQDDM